MAVACYGVLCVWVAPAQSPSHRAVSAPQRQEGSSQLAMPSHQENKKVALGVYLLGAPDHAAGGGAGARPLFFRRCRADSRSVSCCFLLRRRMVSIVFSLAPSTVAHLVLLARDDEIRVCAVLRASEREFGVRDQV